MAKKQILATLAATVAYFLGGWLIFGMLMKDFYASHCASAAQGLMIDPPNMLFITIGCILNGYLVAFVCQRSNSNSIKNAIIMSIRLNVVIGLAIDFMYTSMMNMYTDNWTVIGANVIGNIVMGILSGLAVGLVLSRGEKAA